MTILYLLILAALFGLLEWYLLKKAPEKLGYDIQPQVSRVEPGEPFTVVSEFANDKRLPVLFLEAREKVPESLELAAEPGKNDGPTLHRYPHAPSVLSRTFFLMPRQKLRAAFSCTLGRRGRYLFSGATLSVGDLLGLQTTPVSFDAYREVVVFPKAAATPALDRALGGYLGDMSVQRFIHPDPMLIRGFTDYTGREPMRSISWPRSLQSGHLMVKEYDHTSELTASVLLGITPPAKEEDAADIEYAFSIARSVAETLDRRRTGYTFRMNALFGGSSGVENTSSTGGYGRAHLIGILDQLGRALYSIKHSPEELLEAASRSRKDTSACILIVSAATPSIYRAAARFENHVGCKVLVLDAHVVREHAKGAESGTEEETGNAHSSDVPPSLAEEVSA